MADKEYEGFWEYIEQLNSTPLMQPGILSLHPINEQYFSVDFIKTANPKDISDYIKQYIESNSGF